MAKNKTETAGEETTEKKERKARVLTPVEQELKIKMDAVKTEMKEAKALGKLLPAIEKLSAWGTSKVRDAVSAREITLSNAAE